jgi:hypothetical protein
MTITTKNKTYNEKITLFFSDRLGGIVIFLF